MNTINQNYSNYNYGYGNYASNYTNYNNNYGNYGSQINANVFPCLAGPKGELEKLRDGGVIGGLGGIAGRVWAGLSATSKNITNLFASALKGLTRSIGVLFTANDAYNAYKDDVANGRDPFSLDGTTIRTTASSMLSNAAGGLCGAGAGALSVASGWGTPFAAGSAVVAGDTCYEIADRVGNWAFDWVDELRADDSQGVILN